MGVMGLDLGVTEFTLGEASALRADHWPISERKGQSLQTPLEAELQPWRPHRGMRPRYQGRATPSAYSNVDKPLLVGRCQPKGVIPR